LVDFVKFLYSSYRYSLLNTNNWGNFYTQTPTAIRTNNDKVFHYFQLYYTTNFKPYKESEDTILVKRLNSLNIKRGAKIKSYHLFSNALNYTHNYFDDFDTTLSSTYSSYASFFEFSRNFPQEFYKQDFFLRFIYLHLELIFLLKKIRPKKKLKKKKITPKISINYISGTKRVTTTLRVINAYLNSSTIQNNVARIGNALLYLTLSEKNSFLYKKK